MPEPEELYFAFGSNMHLGQMAARCPDCTLYSRGILRKYRWETNLRGGGNVVEGDPEDFVEGIIYGFSADDITTLRHYEGVAEGYFEETRLDVEIEPLSIPALDDRKPAEAAAMLAKIGGSDVADSFKVVQVPDGQKVIKQALVYVSYKFKGAAPIRNEYRARMKLAMADARVLGVSDKYLEILSLAQDSGKKTAVSGAK